MVSPLVKEGGDPQVTSMEINQSTESTDGGRS